MIHVIGIGPGDPSYQLKVIEELIDQVDIVYGSDRQLASISEAYQSKKRAWQGKLSDLLAEVKENLPQKEMAYLASGDPMIYGIGSYFIRQLGLENVEVYPGVSSTQYLFAKTGIAMNDCYITSSHGREPDFDLIAKLPKTVMVTDQKIGPYQIAQELLQRELHGACMYIGEKLSYSDERISYFPIEDVPDRVYELTVVMIINER